MWQLVSLYLYDAVLVSSCAIAILWGGRDERIGAAIAVAASGATAATGQLFKTFEVGHARYAFLAIGLATLFAFDRLMVRSVKRWPIVATGFQLATVILNLTAIAEPGIAGKILLIRGKFAYPILFALVLGGLRQRWARQILDGARRTFPRHLGKASLVDRN